MLEYILFSKNIRNQFATWLATQGIEFQLKDSDSEYLVLVSEDIDEETESIVEAQYDLMLDESARQINEEDNTADAKHLVGIQFTDKNNNIRQVKLEPETVNKIQRGLNSVELQALVQLIADAVDQADDKPLCESESMKAK